MAQNGTKLKIYYAIWVWGVKVIKYFFLLMVQKMDLML